MNEAPPVRKFMFEKSFDLGGSGHIAERKPVTLKPEQYDALKKESYDAGFTAGRGAAGNEQSESLTAVLARVEKQVAYAAANLEIMQKEYEEQVRLAIFSIARKLLPDFVQKNGLQEIQALLGGVISEMVHEPRLVVRIHDSQFDAVNSKITEITTQKAYVGKVVVLADPETAAGDCRVEWADGGIERNTQETWKNVEHAIGVTGDMDLQTESLKSEQE